MSRYVLALDQGTTSSRAILFDRQPQIAAVAQQEFPQLLPVPGHVEHDPEAIWQSQLATARDAMQQVGAGPADIAAIGVTNQRETTILWRRDTGQPVANAIVWQSRISAGLCDRLKAAGHADKIRHKTGLVIDAYFSATKIRHLLDHLNLQAEAEAGNILFGTVDTWLLWKLSGGRLHVTDTSNASRTMLFNIHDLAWDDELLSLLNIPRVMLPQVRASSEVYGETDPALFGGAIPLAAVCGDQQSATFGQACFQPGMAKNTYGTGCFLLLNTGDKPVDSQRGMLTTVGWTIDGQTTWCLEGAVFVAGAVVQWLRDGLGLIRSSEEVEALALQAADAGGVYLVPAFVGLGAPHWDAYARGTIVGITRGTTAAHLARAALESIAFQTRDVLEAMQQDAGLELRQLRVDGGACRNNLLMQFQADLLGVDVLRPTISETTALGAAMLAGLAVGFWRTLEDLNHAWSLEQRFQPRLASDQRDQLHDRWRKAVERSLAWEPPQSDD